MSETDTGAGTPLTAEEAFTVAVNAPSATGRGIAVPHHRDVDRIWAAIEPFLSRPATDPAGLDVEALRSAIYTVSVRHDWANTTDREDRTEEIAAEYAAELATRGGWSVSAVVEFSDLA